MCLAIDYQHFVDLGFSALPYHCVQMEDQDETERVHVTLIHVVLYQR